MRLEGKEKIASRSEYSSDMQCEFIYLLPCVHWITCVRCAYFFKFPKSYMLI